MSKSAGFVKEGKNALLRKAKLSKNERVSNRIKTVICSGMASAGPPLGPMLGKLGINIASFCKDFNLKTSYMKQGIPIPCRITVNADRSYNLTMHNPCMDYYLKQAAGITQEGEGDDKAGKITLKHIYEIAKIKQNDYTLQLYDLQHICEMLMQTARSLGIQIVRDYDPKEYAEFLMEREEKLEQMRKEMEAAKEAELQRL